MPCLSISDGAQKMTRKVIYQPNHNLKLKGKFYERALQYLSQELALLEEQRHMSEEANQRYLEMEASFSRFKSSRRLGDAIFCARIRG